MNTGLSSPNQVSVAGFFEQSAKEFPIISVTRRRKFYSAAFLSRKALRVFGRITLISHFGWGLSPQSKQEQKVLTKLLLKEEGFLLLVKAFVLLNSGIGWTVSQEQEERTSDRRKEEVHVLWGTLKGENLTKDLKPGMLCSRGS